MPCLGLGANLGSNQKTAATIEVYGGRQSYRLGEPAAAPLLRDTDL